MQSRSLRIKIMESLLTLLGLSVILLLSVPAAALVVLSAYILHLHTKYSHVPGPPVDSFILGHLPSLRRLYKKREYTHNLFLQWAEIYRPVLKIRVLHKVMILPTSTGAVKELLTKSKYPKSKRAYSRISSLCGTRFLGNGLLSNTDPHKWSMRRKAINPAFHKRQLQGMMPCFNEVANSWIRKLSDAADGRTSVIMAHSLCRVTLDAVAKVAFNMDINAVDQESSPFPTAINKIIEALGRSNRDPFLVWRPSARKLCEEVRAGIDVIRSAGRSHLQHRHTQMMAGQNVPNDLTTLLVKSTASVPDLTFEDLIDDFCTLFIAGQETTSNTLAFLLAEIGRRPAVLKRILDELDLVLGDRDEVRYDDVTKLVYLHQVWQETLRMYPPAPGTARDTIHDTVLDGVHIPPGTVCVVSFYVVQRLSHHFEDPLSFRPERFELPSQRSLFGYLPFSLGQRSCAGKQFAHIESKVLLCRFLKTFDFVLDPDQSFEVDDQGTLRPRDGVRMKIQLKSQT